MASGFVYLIHYPDGRDSSVQSVVGPKAEVDDEIVPCWIVFKLATNEQTIDGQAVQYEAWVCPKSEPEAWRDCWRDNPTS